MGKKIAAYMRISVDTEKDRDNTSIENQRRIIKAYLKQDFPTQKLIIMLTETVRVIPLSSVNPI